MSLTNWIITFARIFLPSLNPICTHDKIKPNVDQAYCPDCGKLIKNEWYITRCSCCGAKMKAMVKNGEIIPQNHFCSNCGSEEFTIEQIEQINFIDINFAALVRREVEQKICESTVKCWEEEKTSEQQKLLVQYL